MNRGRLVVFTLSALILCGTADGQDTTQCVKDASELAMQAITTKNQTPVIEKATECIRTHPEIYNAYSVRGNAYLEKGDLDLAITDLGMLIELQSKDLEWYKGEFGKAAINSDYVKDGNTTLVFAYYSRSEAYVKKNEIVKARADLNAALALDPKSWETKQKIADLDKLPAHLVAKQTAEQLAAQGRRQAGQKDYDNAIKSFTECLVVKPDLAACYALRGSVHGLKGSMDLAMMDFGKAIQISPNEFRIYLTRAAMFAEVGQSQKAIADFRTVLKLDPSNSQAKQALQKLGAQP